MTIATTESTITDHEAAQVDRANATRATPVVIVHGLWLLGDERFRVSLTSDEQVAAARAAQAGGRAHPYGPNCPWHAGQHGLELASRGCCIRGEYGRTLRWPALGRGATGHQLKAADATVRGLRR